MKIDISKLNILNGSIGVAGLLLSFVGISFQQFFPWTSFKTDHFLLPRVIEGERYWEWVYYQLSPFILTYRSETGPSVSIWFYRINMTISGLICLIGIGVSIVGILFKKRKTAILGSILVVFSNIIFATSLPGIYPYFTWELGVKFTFYGAIMMLCSALLGIRLDMVEEDYEYVFELKQKWGINKKINLFQVFFKPSEFMT
jgi:hypothetical protein